MAEPVPITSLVAPRRAGQESSVTVKVRPCRIVIFDENTPILELPVGHVIARGSLNGAVKYTSPSPCRFTLFTKIRFAPACSYRMEELEHNVLIYEKCTRKERRYPYPKSVWNELYKFYIEPLTRDEKPYNTGVLLMGPPGTGKSNLARLAAKYVGVNVVKIDSTIQSKFVGESERRLSEAISNARDMAPSIIIIDDAEWLFMARSLSGEDQGSNVRLDLLQILFDRMQEIYDNEERVLFIASTNMRQEALDQALLRHGRFGPPIYVPLPDYEAARIIVHDILSDIKNEKEIEEIAFTAVNAGLSAADIIALAEKVRRGGEPLPKTVGGRGYSRIYIRRVEDFNVLEKNYHVPVCSILNNKSRLWIRGNEDIATAFATQMAYMCKKTVIRLVDPRKFDEASTAANMLNSIFIYSTRLTPEIQDYLHNNTDTALIGVGEKPPAIPYFMIGSTETLAYRLGVEASLKAVLALINKPEDPELINKIKKKVAADKRLLINILYLLVTTRTTENIENMLAWMS